MEILIGCERSGVVREAFRALGHSAWSCDLELSDDKSDYHIQGDLRDIMHDWPWDMMIAHPECTYLASSGLHWNKRRPERQQLTKEGVMFFLEVWGAPIPKIVLENPIGCMSTILRKPDQYIQPYEFGDDASKKTCLWLKGLKPLVIDPDKRCAGRWVEYPEYSGIYVERWSNQTDSGQNRLGPSEDRARIRGVTYPGIAKAFADAWG